MPTPDMSAADDQFMALALRLSKRNLGRCWPNPSVGAVVTDGADPATILGVGVTDIGGRPHAERRALAMAGEKAKGGTIYVTLEPCSHHGKTPLCSDAITEAGIGRVVYAMVDADPRVAGSGIQKLQDAGIKTCKASDAMTNRVMRGARAHIKRVQSGCPFVQAKLAVGSDGLMKAGDGTPNWVTSPMSRNRGHLLRARADAILVGRGTVIADNPSLTCRLPGMEDRSPIRIILDTNLKIDKAATVIKTAQQTPTWIICNKEADQHKAEQLSSLGAQIIYANRDKNAAHIDLTDMLEQLGKRGITRLLVEGGPTIVRSFVEQQIADEVYLFQGNNPAAKAGEEAIDPLAGAGLNLVTQNTSYKKAYERALGQDQLTIFRKQDS